MNLQTPRSQPRASVTHNHSAPAHRRLPIVAVFGSGRDPHMEQSAKLGTWLASQNVHLLTGGGGGVMLAVSHAFATVPERHGLVIGIVPGQLDDRNNTCNAPVGYPNPRVEVPIMTHLPHSGKKGTQSSSRNHINVLTGDVIIILPGQWGTAAEAELAVRYNKPAVAWLTDTDRFEGLHPSIPVVQRFGQVKKFVTAHLPDTNG